MSTGSIAIYLLAGITCAAGIWLLMHRLCSRTAKGREQQPDCGEEAQETPNLQALQQTYRRILVWRLGGLLLCLVALAFWLADSHWLTCLLLAGGGCLLQYRAYRARTAYVLALARQKQAAASGTWNSHSPKDTRG